jgi:hypothetical protein
MGEYLSVLNHFIMGSRSGKMADERYYLSGSEDSLNTVNVPTCFVCRRMFPNYEKLSIHFENDHSHLREEYLKMGKPPPESHDDEDTVTMYQCFVCHKTFWRKRELPDHFRIEHSPIIREYPRISPGSDSSVRMYECHVCRKLFSKKSGRSNHLKKDHSKSEIESAFRVQQQVRVIGDSSDSSDY